jgi:hypothetical protein
MTVPATIHTASSAIHAANCESGSPPTDTPRNVSMNSVDRHVCIGEKRQRDGQDRCDVVRAFGRSGQRTDDGTERHERCRAEHEDGEDRDRIAGDPDVEEQRADHDENDRLGGQQGNPIDDERGEEHPGRHRRDVHAAQQMFLAERCEHDADTPEARAEHLRTDDAGNQERRGLRRHAVRERKRKEHEKKHRHRERPKHHLAVAPEIP